jgi:hypothetical protein
LLQDRDWASFSPTATQTVTNLAQPLVELQQKAPQHATATWHATLTANRELFGSLQTRSVRLGARSEQPMNVSGFQI